MAQIDRLRGITIETHELIRALKPYIDFENIDRFGTQKVFLNSTPIRGLYVYVKQMFEHQDKFYHFGVHSSTIDDMSILCGEKKKIQANSKATSYYVRLVLSQIPMNDSILLNEVDDRKWQTIKQEFMQKADPNASKPSETTSTVSNSKVCDDDDDDDEDMEQVDDYEQIIDGDRILLKDNRLSLSNGKLD